MDSEEDLDGEGEEMRDNEHNITNKNFNDENMSDFRNNLFFNDGCDEESTDYQIEHSGSNKISNKKNAIVKKNTKTIEESDKKSDSREYLSFLLTDTEGIVFEVLQKEVEKLGCIKTLNEDKSHKFWTGIYSYVKNLTEKSSIDVLPYWDAVLSLVLDCLDDLIKYDHPLGLTISFFNALLFENIDVKFLMKISEMCEKCYHMQIQFQGKFYLDTINFLLETTLDDSKVLKSYIRRVWDIKSILQKINLDSPFCSTLVKRLIKIPKSQIYLSCKDGQGIISFLFGSLDINLIRPLHNSVKDFLPTAKRNQAAIYGEIYFYAWNQANSQFRKEFEEICLQDLMKHIFTFPRKSFEMNRLGQNVFELLKFLHNSRKHVHFSKVLTGLYKPLLWRYLRSGNNAERCNACEVFFDVYPLETPGKGRAAEMEFQEKQFNEMIDLLSDDCHIVRIISIKGVCSKLASCWKTFPPEIIRSLIRKIVHDLANDGSSVDVRKTVYKGLSILLKNPDALNYLKRILPQIDQNIHDVNEKVRYSFVQMLITLKELQSPVLKFHEVVSVKHLLARLQHEKKFVGEALVELLIDNVIYQDKRKTFITISKMILVNPMAARNFFKFSKNSLKFNSAYDVISYVLISLRSSLKKQIQGNNSMSQEESVEPARKKQKSLKENLVARNVENNDENEKISQEQDNNYNHPMITYGYIDIITILWYLNSKELLQKENEEKLRLLFDITAGTVPFLMKCYKIQDNRIIHLAVITLASMVPLNKLSPTSTIGSACISQLKSISEATSSDELAVFVNALCAWNRVGEIIDLVINCFDKAFSTEGLNQSAIPTKNYKKRTVKFNHVEVKPILALRILDLMFRKEVNQINLMKRSYNHLYELVSYLPRVKVLAENRINCGAPLENSSLSDEFIVKCLYRYYKMMIFLSYPSSKSESDKTIIASVEMIGIMDWANRIILPYLPCCLEDEPGICEQMSKCILRSVRHIISGNIGIDNQFLMKTINFMRHILSFGCSLWFLEESFCILKFMMEHIEAFFEEEDSKTLLQTSIPLVIDDIFVCISHGNYSQQEISKYIKSLKEVKLVISEILQFLKIYEDRSVLHQVLRSLLTSCITVNSMNIRELQIVETGDLLNGLPFISFFLFKILMSRQNLTNIWLTALNNEIRSSFSKDASMLLSSVSLFYTLSLHSIKFPKDLLIFIHQTLQEVIDSFKDEDVYDSISDDVSVNTAVSRMNIKELADPILAKIFETLK